MPLPSVEGLTYDEIVAAVMALPDDEAVALANKYVGPPHQSELRKCANDICYWFSKYLRSYDPREADSGDAYSPFVLFPKQEECIQWIQDRVKAREGGVIEKSRDSGASYICVGFALHQFLFKPGFAAGFGSRKGEYVDKLGDPKSLFEKLRMLFRGLPDWMKPKGFTESKHGGECRLVNPANGSTITGESGDGIGRGGRTSVYFVDEAAYLEHPKLADASLSQTTNVRIDVSTPNGLDEFYTKTRSRRVKVFRLHWIDDSRKNRWETTNKFGIVVATGQGRHETEPIPSAFDTVKRDGNGLLTAYPWYERERMRPEYIDPAIMAQEVDIDYIGSGRPRFNRKWLMAYREAIYPDGNYHPEWGPLRIEEHSWAAPCTTFEDPLHGRSYAVLVDTARGLNLQNKPDWSVAHVFDMETCEQVCHYRGQITEGEFATDLFTLGIMYNRALMVVETPGAGEAVLALLAANVDGRRPYPNIYHDYDEDARPAVSTSNRSQSAPGLRMTTTSKPEGDGKLASMLEDAEKDMRGAILLRHPNTLEELFHFVRLRGETTGAEAGAFDDEVSCLRLLALIWSKYTTRGQRKMRELTPAPPQSVGATAGWRR